MGQALPPKSNPKHSVTLLSHLRLLLPRSTGVAFSLWPCPPSFAFNSSNIPLFSALLSFLSFYFSLFFFGALQSSASAPSSATSRFPSSPGVASLLRRRSYCRPHCSPNILSSVYPVASSIIHKPSMPGLFSRINKARDARLKKKTALNGLDGKLPTKPKWDDAYTRPSVDPEEVDDLLQCCVKEIKSRGRTSILLRFRYGLLTVLSRPGPAPSLSPFPTDF